MTSQLSPGGTCHDVPDTSTVMLIIFFQNKELLVLQQGTLILHCMSHCIRIPSFYWYLQQHWKSGMVAWAKIQTTNRKITCFVMFCPKWWVNHLDTIGFFGGSIWSLVPPRSNWTGPGLRNGPCLCHGVESGWRDLETLHDVWYKWW